MEKKFTVLRIIGTLWKIMAWIALVIGVLTSIGVLMFGIFSGSMMRDYVQVPTRASWATGVAGGVVGFVGTLIGTIIYFLMMYAVGELIYLGLAIEENTRQASQHIQWMAQEVPAPVYAPPPAPAGAPPAPEPAGAVTDGGSE
jgi:hypothetical protein